MEGVLHPPGFQVRSEAAPEEKEDVKTVDTRHRNSPHVNLFVVGRTGSGKSPLMNGYVSLLEGVPWHASMLVEKEKKVHCFKC